MSARPRLALGVVPPAFKPLTYVRYMQPFDYLGPFGWTLRMMPEPLVLAGARSGRLRIDEEVLEGVDVVLFPQVPTLPDVEGFDHRAAMETFCAEARRRGAKLVYAPDDDIWSIAPHNPFYTDVVARRPLADVARREADAFLVTTAELGRVVDDGRRPVHVVPNTIEPRRWRTRPRTSGEWRVGWSGSAAHAPDLLMVLPALRTLRARQPVHVYVQGLTKEPLHEALYNLERICAKGGPAHRDAYEPMLELMRGVNEMGATHVPYYPSEEHFARLPAFDFDIGICPLVDAPFNRSKSAIKFAEYAISGTMTIASDVVPYAGEVSVTVPNDPAAWADVLEHWLRRRPEREAEYARQREFVLRERNIEHVAARWAAVLDAILAS